MASAATIEVTQVHVFGAGAQPADTLDVTQAHVLSGMTGPAQEIRATQAMTFAAEDSMGNELKVYQAHILVAVRGRVADPRVRAWTFTLDGHDFYVLQVGTFETLVYDLSTGEWFTWGSSDEATWRAKIGINWPGTGRLPGQYGTNILVGDDSVGALYFLDPNYDRDDNATGDGRKQDFIRRVTAQWVINSGYNFPPCYGVQAYGSIGATDALDPSDIPADLTVSLTYSDDRGNSYVDAGTFTVATDNWDFRLNWQSLGSMRAPGRVFRMEDWGAMRAVDGFEIEDGSDV
jgi:hypothetical protein